MGTTSRTSNDVTRVRNSQMTLTDDTTLTEAGAGTEYNIATDDKTITLPKIEADSIGMILTFRNTGADGNNIITLSPNAADGVNGSIANAAADSVAGGVVNKNFVNTKTTANLGDYVILRAVALTKWFIIGGVGIWASEG